MTITGPDACSAGGRLSHSVLPEPGSPHFAGRCSLRGGYDARGRASFLTYSLGVAGALPLAFAVRAGRIRVVRRLSAQIRRCGAG
jgi:hypothetical protein